MNLKKYLPPEMKAGMQVLEVIAVNKDQSETGASYFRLTMENEDGTTMCHNFQVTKRGLPFFVRFCQACGIHEDALEKFELEDLVGRKFLGDVFMNKGGFWALKSWERLPEDDEEQEEIVADKDDEPGDDIITQDDLDKLLEE